MLISFASMAGGFLLIFRGISVFGCTSVSFSRDFTTCYQSELGALPGAVAGSGLMVVGAVLFFVAMIRLVSVR